MVSTNRTFYFRPSQSPTIVNLTKQLIVAGFEQSNGIQQANFTDKNLELDEEVSQALEYKHLLAGLVNQYCPETTPLTYVINDNNHEKVIRTIEREHAKNPWILKPALLNNAEGIKLFSSVDEVYDHYASNQRYSGYHVLQQYLNKPHLLDGHKYTLRMFVVLTNFAGAYLYKDGYYNIAREKYDASDFSQLNTHLTNEHLNPNHEPNVVQMPTRGVPNFELIFEKIRVSVAKTLDALNQEKPQQLSSTEGSKALSFFGFDFMLDEDLRLWLLEVNHGPCFPVDVNHVLQKHLYDDFWRAVVSDFVIPLVEDKRDNMGGNDSFVPVITSEVR